jgi:hypothetical protein
MNVLAGKDILTKADRDVLDAIWNGLLNPGDKIVDNKVGNESDVAALIVKQRDGCYVVHVYKKEEGLEGERPIWKPADAEAGAALFGPDEEAKARDYLVSTIAKEGKERLTKTFRPDDNPSLRLPDSLSSGVRVRANQTFLAQHISQMPNMIGNANADEIADGDKERN